MELCANTYLDLITRNKSEIEIASLTMGKHLEAHCSFISYQFHGLFLSSVVCPVCRKQSAQSDPLACVSLPVLQSTKKPLYVTMVFLHNEPRLLRYGLNADVTATFREVKECLSKAAKITIEQIILCELSLTGFVQSFADEDDISNLGALKFIYAFETPNFRQQQEIIVLACNRVYDATTENRFGSPVALRVYRGASYRELRGSVVAALRHQLSPCVNLRDIQDEDFRLRLMDDFHESSLLPENFQLPLYSNMVDDYLSSQRRNKGPQHLKIMIEWSNISRQNLFGGGIENILDHKSALDLKQQEIFPDCQTLNECLEDFTQEETLQWYCPDCRQHQERARKRTSFYWLPNILTIHLKRNKQLPSGQLVKLDPLVKFPIYGLDLTAFTHQSSPHVSRRRGPIIDTYCRNPVNGFWYCFDDQSVTRIEERKLVTNAAYMLFYERKISRSINTSCHNSTESGFVDHWFFKLSSSLSRQQQKNNVHGGLISDGRASSASGQAKENGRMYVALPPTIENKNSNSTINVGKLISLKSNPSDYESNESSPPRAPKFDRFDGDSARFHLQLNNNNLFFEEIGYKTSISTNDEKCPHEFPNRIRTNSTFETDLEL
uniref:ubiquitinyl hydrolase 1 n=1 Tax=Romanomermis culicivorax TaxID=13658 RepID=A0A915JQW6_ROMCU